MKKIILDTLEQSIATKEGAVRGNVDNLLAGAERIAESLASGHKILLFGNGGSAADAQHIAAEFVNRFAVERAPLAALALTTDTSVLTSIGNDYRFDDIFSKQIRALGKEGDVAWGISTSGNSKNIVSAVKTAREMGLLTFGMTGSGGGLADCAEILFTVPSNVTARIQEAHITLAHILCDLVDRILFPEKYR
ncbi:MAG: SIS domain-containing protein [Desulfobacteraceae bacterium]|nr:MAG: SIS domain-containing protein [Desulfobacteraceae bacterium]